MKITKRQLRRIIKEEKARLAEAQPWSDGRTNSGWAEFEDAAFAIASELIAAGMEWDGVQDSMQASVAEIIARINREEDEMLRGL